MISQTLLTSLFRYKAWADEGLIAGLIELGGYSSQPEYATALGILNHAHIVDQIFVENLQQRRHTYTSLETDELPRREDLFKAIKEIDQWYIDYVGRLGSLELEETIKFQFTDGTHGRMSREEMLAHTIAHAGYHRGEVGRIMTQLSGSSPRDTYTGYLHEVEPERCERVQ